MNRSKKRYGVMLARQMTAISKNLRSEESLDFSQALNTCLSFLCWVNADAQVAEEFLTRWPEALLLEGSNQDCASCIVKQRMGQCTCRDELCNQNREKLLEIMGRGFPYYQDKHMHELIRGRVFNRIETPMMELKSTSVFPQLMSTGRYLRNLSIEESAVHSQVVVSHAAKMVLERQLKEAKAVAKGAKSRIRFLFACGSDHVKEQQNQIARLEYDLQMAELKLASVEKEHGLLENAIDQGHRSQYALLKGVFEGCARHECIHSRTTNDTEQVGD